MLSRYDDTHGTTAIRGGRIVSEWRLPNGHAWRDEEHMHRVLQAWYHEQQKRLLGEPRKVAA